MNHADFALQNVSTLREDASKGSDDELAALGLDWRLSAAVGILDHGEASLAKTRTEKTLYTSGILMEDDFVDVDFHWIQRAVFGWRELQSRGGILRLRPTGKGKF